MRLCSQRKKRGVEISLKSLTLLFTLNACGADDFLMFQSSSSSFSSSSSSSSSLFLVAYELSKKKKKDAETLRDEKEVETLRNEFVGWGKERGGEFEGWGKVE